MHIVSHRGIDLSLSAQAPESTEESFIARTTSGFGIEFDLVELSCGGLVVSHDSEIMDVAGIKINLQSLALGDLRSIRNKDHRIITLEETLNILSESGGNLLHALHLKARNQTSSSLQRLCSILSSYRSLLPNIIIFDLLPKSASIFKKIFPESQLAFSLSHQFDIERFNPYCDGTLFDLDFCLKNSNICNWVWLDEWDNRADKEDSKSLHTPDLYSKIRSAGLKIALVTPDLHSCAPSKEFDSHPDSKEPFLSSRLKDILCLNPDLICTDFPSLTKMLSDQV